MRRIPAFLALLFTVNAFAGNYHVNFDAYQEIKCFEELKLQGCVLNDEEDVTCALKKKQQLSLTCQKIQEEKKLSM